MAAVDDSPSRCQGQPWMIYAQRTGLNSTNEESGDEKDVKDAREGDAMKLRKEDMPLFGSCPAQEEFYLVVCEECGIVIKPQALRSHIERRHTCNNSVLSSSDGGGGSSRSGDYSSSGVVNKLGVKEMCRPSSRGSSGSSATGSKSCDNKSNSQLSRFAIPPKQHQQHNLSAVPANKIISGLQNKLDLKLDSKNAACYSGGAAGSKKNHHAVSPPVVKVDRMLPSGVSVSGKKLSVNNSGSNANVSPSALPSDKRELPSPQQPPPSSPDSPYFLDNSPMNVFSNQQQGLASPSGSNKNSQVTSVPAQNSGSVSVNKKNNSTNNSSNANNSSETKVKSSKSKKVPKERKLLPCKDRVYDPDKHCGVNNPDGKPCTRSLTCKTHSLAMRRNVPGRRKRFDELLSDHRATKEATVKASKSSSVTNNKKAESNAFDAVKLNATPVSATTSGSANFYLKGSSKVNCSNGGSSHLSTSGESGGRGSNQRLPINVPSAKSKSLNAKNHVSSTPIQRTQSSGSSSQSTSNETQRKSSSFDSLSSSAAQPVFSSVDRKEDEDDDDGSITHHPKPAAVCTFNSRQMGLGFYVHDRKLDSIRAVLRLALVERISQSPSVKKLCVESKLPPVPESSDPSDPYCFTFGEQTNSISSSVTASASLTVPVTSCGSKSMTLTSTTNVSATAANSLKSPPIQSHSFSMKSSSQKLGKSFGNRPPKNKLNKDSGVSGSVTNTNSQSSNGNGSVNISDGMRKPGSELTKGVRSSSGNIGVGGASLKRKRGSNTNTNNFTYQPVINNSNINNSNSNIVMNSPPYQQQQSGAAHLQGAAPSNSPTSNLLSVSFPVGLNVSQLTNSGTSGGKATHSFAIPTCVSSVSATGSVGTSGAGAGRNHNTSTNIVGGSGNMLKDIVVTNVEVVNGQLGGRGNAVGGPTITNSGAVVSPSSNAKTTCISVTNADTVRTSMCGINLGLAAGTAAASSPSYLSSISNSSSCGPNRASPNSSPSQMSTFSLVSSTTKETKPPNTKRSKSSSSSSASSSAANSSFKTVKHGHNSSPNTSSTSMNSIPSSVNKWNNTTVLTGMGALSNANLLANNNHVAISRLDQTNALSPQDSNFISAINIKSSLSSHLSASSPLLNGLGPSSSPLHHRNLTNHILPANTANTFTVNSDSQIGISNSDGSSINSETSLQTKGRGSRSNACRSSMNSLNKHQVQIAPNSTTSGSLSLGNKMDGDLLPSVNQDSTNNSSSQLSSHLSSIPLKLLNSSLSGSKSKSQKPFGLHNSSEFKRPTEMQGSSTLPT